MSRIGNTIPNAEPAPAPCDHVWGDPQNRDGTLKTCQKCGIGGAPAPTPAPAIGAWRVADFGEYRECFFPAMYAEAEVRRAAGWVRNERNNTVRILPACKWTESDPWGREPQTWETDCDNMFYFSEGGPKENQMAFCCYCGKPLEEKPWKDEEESDDED